MSRPAEDSKQVTIRARCSPRLKVLVGLMCARLRVKEADFVRAALEWRLHTIPDDLPETEAGATFHRQLIEAEKVYTHKAFASLSQMNDRPSFEKTLRTTKLLTKPKNL